MPSSESETSLRKQEIGKAAIGAAIGENRGGGHEPKLAHGVVQTLGVGGIIGVGAGDAGEHVLKALARHQIAVGQGRLAESGQKNVTRMVQGEIGRQSAGCAASAVRAERLGGVLDDFPLRPGGVGFPGSGGGALGQLRPIRHIDQLALLIEIAMKIEFADRRHAMPPQRHG